MKNMRNAEQKMQNDGTRDLLKLIGLQFFAEDEEDFDDDFDDIPEYYGWDHDDDEAEDPDEDIGNSGQESEDDTDDDDDTVNEEADDSDHSDNADDADEDTDEGADDTDRDAEDDSTPDPVEAQTNPNANGTDDAHAELISELQALGYVGDDLASLAQDMKRKRENAKLEEASVERKARNAAGKEHVSTSRPNRNVGGDGGGGFSSKQVRNLQQTLGCSYERARELLSKQVRAIG